MTRSWKRVVTTLVAGLALTAGSAVAAGPAQAAMAFSEIDSATVGQFTLDPVSSFDGQSKNSFDVYGDAINAVEASGAITRMNSTAVLTSGGWAGTSGLCHDTGLSSSLSPSGFCWTKGDDTSNSYTETGGWTPQGLTGSYDAQPDGLVDGHTAFLASWHFSRKMGTAGGVSSARWST